MSAHFTNREVVSTPNFAPARFTDDFVHAHGTAGRFPGMRDVEFIEGLCDRFMVACQASGLGKAEFAASVGLTGPQLTNISRYRNPPPHKAIANAARIYGLTTDYFYLGAIGGMRDQSIADRIRKLAVQPARA